MRNKLVRFAIVKLFKEKVIEHSSLSGRIGQVVLTLRGQRHLNNATVINGRLSAQQAIFFKHFGLGGNERGIDLQKSSGDVYRDAFTVVQLGHRQENLILGPCNAYSSGPTMT